MTEETLSPIMTVVGLVNGMIGGLILILPLLALDAGYILTFIVILITGFFSLYSCYLCVQHMGDQPDLDLAIFVHFNGNAWTKIFYDLLVWTNLFLIGMLYFVLIVKQWQNLIPPYETNLANPLCNGAALLGLIFLLRYFNFGASLMAYGIVSIKAYLIFLIWVVITVPSGPKAFTPIGINPSVLAAGMGQAFSIQSFFIPILKKSKNPQDYMRYVLIAYVIGTCAYLFIGYMGAFGILNRISNIAHPDTIQDFFENDAWEVKIIEVIYLIHLYSVFPEFIIISKKRFFGIFKIESPQKLSMPEVAYFCAVVLACLGIYLLHFQISDIIEINGAVIAFFFIYFIPIWLHVKCIYFSKGKVFPLRDLIRQKPIQPACIQLPQPTKTITQIQSDRPFTVLEQKEEKEGQISQKLIAAPDFSSYKCEMLRPPRGPQAINWMLMVVMGMIGAFVMVEAFIQLAGSG